MDECEPLVLGTMRLALDDFSETKQAVSSRASTAALEELAAIEALMAAAVEAEPATAGPDDDAASPLARPSGTREGGALTDVVSLAVRRVKEVIEEHGPDFLPLRSFVEQFDGGLYMNRVRVLTRYIETYLDAEEPFACSASFEAGAYTRPLLSST